jgi:hypothetical protein
LLIAWLRSSADASPTVTDLGPHDRNATARASSPWIDLAPNSLLGDLAESRVRPSTRRRKIVAAATLAGLYAGFTTWTYFAWYRNKQKNIDQDGNYVFKWGGDRWFEVDTYAGGADKLGHGWATMALARGGTELLYQGGGFSKLTSALIGAGLSELLFFGVEVKDGAYYQFSYGDFVFNTAGAALGVLLSTVPALDDLIDFRVQYWPSREYKQHVRASGDVNVAEDYSGQTYLLALHLGGIPALRRARWGGWSRFVDVAIGFETRGYKPEQIPVDNAHPVNQKLFIGLTLNAQGLFDYLLRGRSEPARKITHGMFEFFNLPASTLPVLDGERGTTMSEMGGA